jgi:hypothetical protein
LPVHHPFPVLLCHITVPYFIKRIFVDIAYTVDARSGHHARAQGVEQVLLTVKAANERAWRVYERLGFTRWGVEPRALRSPGGEYFDDVHMWKPV